MTVIAVANKKGGSGKSTLAAHLAAFCAHAGLTVMLGDADKQQSSRLWLKLRSQKLPAILGGSIDIRQSYHLLTGVTHLVIDTPGGLTGFELSRLIQQSDVILIPVSGSVFDRESTADMLSELRKHPKVIAGRCKLGLVGMRMESNSNAAKVWEDWAQHQGVPILGLISNSNSYINCIEKGISIFDMPVQETVKYREQWRPILEWLGPLLFEEKTTLNTQINKGIRNSLLMKC